MEKLGSLKALRAEIAEIDHKIFECLARRMQLSTEVGILKNKEDLPIYQPKVEAAVKERYQRLGAELGLDHTFVQNFCQMILVESVKVQKQS